MEFTKNQEYSVELYPTNEQIIPASKTNIRTERSKLLKLLNDLGENV